MSHADHEVECPWCGAVMPAGDVGSGGEVTCMFCRGVFRLDGGDEPAGQVAAAAPALDLPESDWSGPTVVCCAREQRLSPPVVGPIIAQFTGLSRSDALTAVNRGKGILAEGLGPDEARGMCEALSRQGIEAFCLAEAAVPALGAGLKYVHVQGANPKALLVQTDEQGTVKPVPWRLLAAAVCTCTSADRHHRTETVTDTRYGPYGSTYTIKRQVRRMGEAKMNVTLVFRDRQGAARTMDMSERDVNYGFLGERMQPSADVNMMAFLEGMLEWAPGAFFPEGLRAAARGDALKAPRGLAGKARENYLHWATCCAAARGLFGGRPDEAEPTETT